MCCTWSAMLAKSVCWLLLWLRKASGTQWAVCSSAGRTSHFTYGKQCGILCWALPWKEHLKKKNLLREERSSGHVSRQLVEPSMPTSCHLDELLTAFPSSWFENVECREIMLPICYQTAEKVFVLGRQAFPATLSQQPSSCLPWKLATPKEVFPSADTGPVRGCGIWVAGLKKQVCVRMSTGL